VRFGIPLVHRWRALKWGSSKSPLDCRECRWCTRFEVYAYGSYRKADRSAFEPTWGEGTND
jgi:hypothetical protein